MDSQVRDFILKAAPDLAGLDVALYFHAHPATFDSPAGLALRLHRGVDDVARALDRLHEYGLLEVLRARDGRYRCYALKNEPGMWETLCQVSNSYLDDADSRKEIVRMLAFPCPVSKSPDADEGAEEHRSASSG